MAGCFFKCTFAAMAFSGLNLLQYHFRDQLLSQGGLLDLPVTVVCRLKTHECVSANKSKYMQAIKTSDCS